MCGIAGRILSATGNVGADLVDLMDLMDTPSASRAKARHGALMNQ